MPSMVQSISTRPNRNAQAVQEETVSHATRNPSADPVEKRAEFSIPKYEPSSLLRPNQQSSNDYAAS